MLRGMHPSTAPREVQGHTGTRRDAHNSQPQLRGCRTTRGRGGWPPPTARSWKSPHHSLQGYKQWGESRGLCSCRREELREAVGGGTPPSSAPLPCSLGGGRGGQGAAPQYIQEEGQALPVRGQEQGLRSVQNTKALVCPCPGTERGQKAQPWGERQPRSSPPSTTTKRGTGSTAAAQHLPTPPEAANPAAAPAHRTGPHPGWPLWTPALLLPASGTRGGSWQPQHIQTTPYLSMSPPSFSLK